MRSGLAIEKQISMARFKNQHPTLIGSWLPFALIFPSIYVTGVCAKR
jgi:hypothetical protein